MYHILVLVLCLLGVTASNENVSIGTSIIPDSDTTPSNNFRNECRRNDDCDKWPDAQVCDNWTCFDCYECCANKKDGCPRVKCHCHWFLTDEELKIVAQAVLGVAVFVTCVALLSLLWKICARRLRQRRAVAAGADLLDDTASLSSQQVFVVERLRDRPPRYEEAARDFAIEKPPPYSEVVVEEVERPPQTAVVGGVPITLVVGGLTARDFVAPPPYSAIPVRADTASSPVPPPVPSTPPVQRLRRCVRKVVLIGRLGRRSVTAPEPDRISRPPKEVSSQPCDARRSLPGLSSAVDPTVTDTEPEARAVATGGSRSDVANALPVGRGAGNEELGPIPSSPTSTTA